METSASLTHTCKSCHTDFTGFYCNQCGEKVILPADRSFKKLMSSLFQAVTLADSKFIRTGWLVLKRPGYVSFEMANGRTVQYLKPISLFFLLNLIYFLFPLIQLFSASLNTQLLAPYGSLLTRLIAAKMSVMQMDLASFSLVYNIKSNSLAKMMVMVFVVLASLPLNLLYRKRNRYFTDHVGLSLELACFNLFINAIVLSILVTIIGVGKYLDENAMTFILVSTNLYFLIRSGATFYHEKGWRLIAKSIIMIVFLKLALEAYRLILFFLTLASL